MDHEGISDIAIASSIASAITLVLVGTFFNLLSSGLQIIGIGTAVSLGLNGYRIETERRAGRHRKVAEAIQRLQPGVYNPLLKWAVNSKKYLEERQPDNIPVGIPEEPDLSDNGDYIAIVGDRLKRSLADLQILRRSLEAANQLVMSEYRQALEVELKKTGLKADFENVAISIIGRGRWGLVSIPFGFNIPFIKDTTRTTATILLEQVNDRNNSVVLPDSMLKTITDPSGLPHFQQLSTARTNLLNCLGPLIEELANIIRNGERDWRI